MSWGDLKIEYANMAIRTDEIMMPASIETLRPDFEGPIFISDIDKTYLVTQIDSVRGLLRAAFETAEMKSNVPGFSILLRGARRGAGEQPQQNPLFFITASPPQLGEKIQSKMELDGIEYDGIIYKNQMSHVRRGNFRKLTEQIGYKLLALLLMWSKFPKKAKLVLFGDDSESDVLIYSLLADVLKGDVVGRDLADLLMTLGVGREEALKIGWVSRSIQTPVAPVHAIYINLETGSHPTYYNRFGGFVYPTENTLQAAVSLYEKSLIREQAVRSIGRVMVLQYDFQPKDLTHLLLSGARRGLYGMETLQKLWGPLVDMGILLPQPAETFAQGEVSRLNPNRWDAPGAKVTLADLKRRYSDEGRY